MAITTVEQLTATVLKAYKPYRIMSNAMEAEILVQIINYFAGVGGTSGYSGFSGTSGYSGYSGLNGSASASGISGYSGYSGFSGYSGTNGTNGASGISGYSGYSGSGLSGYSGYSGYSGTNGSNGASGTSGYSGYSGFSGINGSNGAAGASGASGYSGYSGSNGTSGFSGYSGYSGYSGASADTLMTTVQYTDDHQLALTDRDKNVEMNKASANNCQIPLNSTVAFPTGSQIMVTQAGAGQTTITMESGVTLLSEADMVKIAAQHCSVVLLKTATNTWRLFGALTA